MKKISSILLVIVVLLSACKQEKKYGAFTVKGTIKNAITPKVFLQELPFGGDQPIILDSTTLQADGSFTLKGIAKEEGLFRLVLENGPDVLIVNDNEEISVELDVTRYRVYEVKGSPASESLHQLFENYRKKDSALYSTFTQVDSLQKLPSADSLVAVTRATQQEQLAEMNKMVRDYIKESESPAGRYYVLGMASRTMNADELKVLVDESAKKFTAHSGLNKIKTLLDASAKKAPSDLGYPLLNKLAPEITLMDESGKPFSLSSLKGKYVLVDFWASWCGPCRKENPNVVATFDLFKNKNFTILGVSMDQDKESWLQAVKDDKLTWKQISILADWNSHELVPTYQFAAIPFNVLVDPQGVIIASNLTGNSLKDKLAEVLK